jgi:penicillin-binding protein-related factor A (putative recombinase)
MIRGRLQYTKRSGADWISIINNGHATALIEESKSYSSDRLPKSELTPKQIEHLENNTIAGGVSLLLVEFRLPPRQYKFAIPWREVPWTTLRTAESVSMQDLDDQWMIGPMEPCYLIRHCPGAQTGQQSFGRKRVYSRD